MKAHNIDLRRCLSLDNLWEKEVCRDFSPNSGCYGRWRVCSGNVNKARSLLAINRDVHDDWLEREDGFANRAATAIDNRHGMLKECEGLIRSLLVNATKPENVKRNVEPIIAGHRQRIKKYIQGADLKESSDFSKFYAEYSGFLQNFISSNQDRFESILNKSAEVLRTLVDEARAADRDIPDDWKKRHVDFTTYLDDSLSADTTWFSNPEIAACCHKQFIDNTVLVIDETARNHLKGLADAMGYAGLDMHVSNIYIKADQILNRFCERMFHQLFKWQVSNSENKRRVEAGFRDSLDELKISIGKLLFEFSSSISKGTDVESVCTSLNDFEVLIYSGYFNLKEIGRLAEQVKKMRVPIDKHNRLHCAMIASYESGYLRAAIKKYCLNDDHIIFLSKIVHYAFASRLELALIQTPESYRKECRDTILRAEYEECYCPAVITRKLDEATREAEAQGDSSLARLSRWGVSLALSKLPQEWKRRRYREQLEKKGNLTHARKEKIDRLVRSYEVKTKKEELANLESQLEKIPTLSSQLPVSAGGAALQGRRRDMQDCFMFDTFTFRTCSGIEEAEMMMVCDGHGGIDAAEHLSTEFSNRLYEELKYRCELIANEPNPNRSLWALSLVDFYNALVITPVKMNHRYHGEGGTTATLGMKLGSHLYVSNIGDSTTLLLNPVKGTVKQLSAEELVSDKATVERITSYGGFIGRTENGEIGVMERPYSVGSVLFMTSAFGDSCFGGALTARPRVSRKYLGSQGDKNSLLVCYSDAVSEVDNVTNIGRFIIDEYNTHHSEQKAAEALAKQTFMSGSSDNTTVLVRVI